MKTYWFIMNSYTLERVTNMIPEELTSDPKKNQKQTSPTKASYSLVSHFIHDSFTNTSGTSNEESQNSWSSGGSNWMSPCPIWISKTSYKPFHFKYVFDCKSE
uniref:Uncharacterized protein n=1 Tax=Lotus japonicus TaxID=34305 RepID=I3SD93_LOTJA|nr:unknown [Lotus japonicus]